MIRNKAANGVDARVFRTRLLRWFASHKRHLPWREEPRDAYRVWIAETMLQQTQVATVIPYYGRWLERFPTLQSLASASQDVVLKAWEGLGYYSRARNLHKAAQTVVTEYGGTLPDKVDQLQGLPGIGRYTAGAIASLAYGVDVPALDANLKRILARVYTIDSDIRQPQTVKAMWDLCESLLPKGKAGAFNEAMMDLGATICTPRSPTCSQCPLSPICAAYAKRRQTDYPVRGNAKVKPTKVLLTVVVTDSAGRYLLTQRPADGLLGGLWEFPTVDYTEADRTTDQSAAGRQTLSRRLLKVVTDTAIRGPKRIAMSDVGPVTQEFTHLKHIRHVYIVHIPTNSGDKHIRNPHSRWMNDMEIDQVALTSSDRRILRLVRTRKQSD